MGDYMHFSVEEVLAVPRIILRASNSFEFVDTKFLGLWDDLSDISLGLGLLDSYRQ